MRTGAHRHSAYAPTAWSGSLELRRSSAASSLESFDDVEGGRRSLGGACEVPGCWWAGLVEFRSVLEDGDETVVDGVGSDGV